MRKALKSHPKKSPMLRKPLTLCLVLTTMLANSQTSVTAINISTDSADYFLQKDFRIKRC